MKFKTVIEGKEYKPKSQPKILVAVLYMIEIFFNNILPFVLGFYFAVTSSIIILIIWGMTMFFNIGFNFKNDEIKIRIIRGV